MLYICGFVCVYYYSNCTNFDNSKNNNENNNKENVTNTCKTKLYYIDCCRRRAIAFFN